jgi:hypothetical protein
MESLGETLAKIEEQLADSGIYNSERSDKLKALLLDQATQSKKMEEAEELWLAKQEELERSEP